MKKPRPTSPPLLTICLDASGSSVDALDTSGAAKRFMMDAADRLVDEACDALPAYLRMLPTKIEATTDEIRASLRRGYRINGTHVEIDVGINDRNLPPRWLAQIAEGEPSYKMEDHKVAVLIGKAIGWCFGMDRTENAKMMASIDKEIQQEQRQRLVARICHGVLGATHAALTQRMMEGGISHVIGQHGVRQVSMRKSR